ncbi:MAG: PAS domain S-box protein [Spirochaetia bacterium]
MVAETESLDTSQKILLVEDDAVVALTESRLLEDNGYSVIVAHGGEKAVEAADYENIDLVLMDIDLGDDSMDGTEAARKILDRKELPILFLTNHTEKAFVDRVKKITGYGYVLKNAGEFVLLESINTALKLFEYRKLEMKLRENEEKYRAIFENSPLGLFRSTPEGRFLEVNPALAEMLGYPDPESVIRNVYSIAEQIYIRPEERKVIVSKQLESLGMDHFVNRYRRRDGTEFVANLYLKTIRDESGTPLYFEGIVEDITDQIEQEEELRKKTLYLSYLYENTPALLYSFQPGTGSIHISPQVQGVLGFLPDELTEKPMLWHDSIHLEDIAAVDRAIERCIKGEILDVTYRIKDRNGSWHWFQDRANSRIGNDGIVILDGIAFDITEKKKMEEALKSALEVKDFLMKELNHRIKNNLTMIDALINLKNSSLNGAVDLSDLSRQINTIKMMHEMIYQTGETDEVWINQYLRQLLDYIFSMSPSGMVDLSIEVPEIRCTAKTALPIGLLVNEMATNAVKHGFEPEGINGFTVQLSRSSREPEFILSVTNSGKPFPPDLTMDNPDTLGLQLINALTEQLEGTVELLHSPRTGFRVRFPVPEGLD